MSKTIALLVSVAALSFACGSGSTGPTGPPGPEGPPGADGLIGQAFEVEVDFALANDYQVLVEFPSGIEAFETDVVLVYLLVEVDEGVDVWAPLPYTVFFGLDILLYGFDHTFADVLLFLDGTVDPATLDPLYTDAVVFRVAVLPADLVAFTSTASLSETVAELPSVGTVRIGD